MSEQSDLSAPDCDKIAVVLICGDGELALRLGLPVGPTAGWLLVKFVELGLELAGLSAGPACGGGSSTQMVVVGAFRIRKGFIKDAIKVAQERLRQAGISSFCSLGWWHQEGVWQTAVTSAYCADVQPWLTPEWLAEAVRCNEAALELLKSRLQQRGGIKPQPPGEK